MFHNKPHNWMAILAVVSMAIGAWLLWRNPTPATPGMQYPNLLSTAFNNTLHGADTSMTTSTITETTSSI